MKIEKTEDGKTVKYTESAGAGWKRVRFERMAKSEAWRHCENRVGFGTACRFTHFAQPRQTRLLFCDHCQFGWGSQSQN